MKPAQLPDKKTWANKMEAHRLFHSINQEEIAVEIGRCIKTVHKALKGKASYDIMREVESGIIKLKEDIYEEIENQVDKNEGDE